LQPIVLGKKRPPDLSRRLWTFGPSINNFVRLCFPFPASEAIAVRGFPKIFRGFAVQIGAGVLFHTQPHQFGVVARLRLELGKYWAYQSKLSHFKFRFKRGVKICANRWLLSLFRSPHLPSRRRAGRSWFSNRESTVLF